jgi:predicted secreted Zn-dependent protease
LLPLGAHAAYGTKVPEVRKAQLSFLAVVQVSTYAETGESGAEMQNSWNLRHQMERMGTARKMIRCLTGEKS